MAKLQSTVALSTSEAETNAATEAVKQLMHMRLFLRELGMRQKYPTVVYEDNNATIAFSEGTGNKKENKTLSDESALLTRTERSWRVRDEASGNNWPAGRHIYEGTSQGIF